MTVRHQPDTPSTDAAEARWLDHWRRGPQMTRWETLPIQIGDRAPDRTLVEARSGEERALSTLWAERPAVLLFWRHFGCGCGRDRSKMLHEEYGALLEAGANVALIGQGDVERARVYADANALPPGLPLFVESDEATYRAYGLLDAFPQHILFDAPDEYLCIVPEKGEEFRRARRDQGMPMVDNPWLLPGEFVVDAAGIIRNVHRFSYCEDWLDARVNIAAVRFATGELTPHV
jgi:peroxiredoxin